MKCIVEMASETDGTVSNNKSDVINCDNDEGTCVLK
jgi:hypothetical protein